MKRSCVVLVMTVAFVLLLGAGQSGAAPPEQGNPVPPAPLDAWSTTGPTSPHGADAVGTQQTSTAPAVIAETSSFPPDIEVTPASLEVTLLPDRSTNRTLTINNLGGALLDFQIDEENTTSEPEWLASQARSSVQMLAWVRYTDYDQEYPNTLAAISQYFSDYAVTESSTLDPAVLAAELAGKDVLLLPEPEEGTTVELEAAGAAFQTTLQGFVSSGGVVVATCEWLAREGFMRSAALLDAQWVRDSSSGDLTVADAGHPLAAGLGSTVPGAISTASYVIGDADVQQVVIDSSGDPVVAARDIGTGHVVLIGYDYFYYNNDAARIIANAVQWAEASADVPWLSEAPTAGSVAPSASQEVTVTFDATGLAPGPYTANLIIANNDPDENPVTVPVTLTVNEAPEVGTVIPSSGSGPIGYITYFTTTWTDGDGWQDLKHCYFHIGASPSLVGNVTLLYNVVKSKLWLLDDSGTTWTGGFAPGSGYELENSQAIVYCDLTVAGVSGDTLSVMWAIEFRDSYRGAKKTGLKCKDIHKAKAKGKWLGIWTVE
jgi:hypothetical protein